MGRSPGNDTGVGPCQDLAPSADQATRVCSWLRPALASAQASTIMLVASAPVGAPLAMSTLGAAARSVRAPVNPSITHRPDSGSMKKQGSVIRNSVRGLVQWTPPSNDCSSTWAPWVGSPVSAGFWNISANTYTTPWLSVRTVHPDSPNSVGPRPPVPAGVTCLVRQLLPPSGEVAIISGAGELAGRCCPTLRNCGKQA